MIIVKAAFNPQAVAGVVTGSMLIAMQKGVARGIFSNEAGLGSAPIKYSEAPDTRTFKDRDLSA